MSETMDEAAIGKIRMETKLLQEEIDKRRLESQLLVQEIVKKSQDIKYGPFTVFAAGAGGMAALIVAVVTVLKWVG